MNKRNALRDLHSKWLIDSTCTLKKTATQGVPGDGTPYADIVFIGEAPGKKEDELGIPFVGAAGKFLDEMLADIHLKRNDVYITNIVKYRPPDNRDPLEKEKQECNQWLIDELNLIQPTLIITLGRHAMNNFFPDEKISNTHGTLLNKKIPGIPTKNFYILYHPAAALYNGSLRDILIKDFKKIPKLLKKLRAK
ncbi:uracil-DNA glycosylase [Candidatus Wolfebacteria bacterium]|nr:MAG: uracil-DNA glycosylase [Candidatus Wolfebacteria bacterium]